MDPDEEQEGPALATPYPWGPYGDPSVIGPSRGKRKGSGIQFLHAKLHRGEISDRAQDILADLLDGADEDPIDTPPLASAMLDLKALPIPALSSWADEETVRQAPDISLLATILNVIDSSATGSAVPTRQIIRQCCLSVNPGSVPSNMDAKEMTLAALVFMSQHHNNEVVSLPLIQSSSTSEDLEKRSYEKVGMWNLMDEEFQIKLRWLETLFLEAGVASKDLPREKNCPMIPTQDESGLFLKGTIPPSASSAKGKKGGRRNSTSPG
uniref:Uncharacterized protein n=1 Tax=Grammatophora oceanica TaxID=210454 RepID=A0A7S1YJQ4_9STRA|mmetsp:Transcript_53236/g.79511  ORF Transcript_53236/g.79511 Transcript_53236/m.79511 type:complete len:267 (+) Transcript_53236:34-834(+)